MLALAAVLVWLSVIVSLSWFRADVSLGSWIKTGVIGSIPIYVMAYFILHAIAIVVRASRDIARAKQEESDGKEEQTEVVDGAG
jgi:hypothetical protein